MHSPVSINEAVSCNNVFTVALKNFVSADIMSTFIRQKAETQQNYTCTPHTRTHTHTHTL